MAASNQSTEHITSYVLGARPTHINFINLCALVSQNVLTVATATFPGILLIFLVLSKNQKFRHERSFETISRRLTIQLGMRYNHKTSFTDLGVGVDIVSTKKFRAVKKKDFAFWKKIFTKDEWTYCFRDSKPDQHLAGIFAAKEAVMKAAGGKILGRFDKIGIKHDKDGKPYVVASNRSGMRVRISISTEKEFTVAVAIRINKIYA